MDTTRFVWDDERAWAEGDSLLRRVYTYEPGSVTPFSVRRSGLEHYYLYDEAHSVRAILKENATISHAYRYYPFGLIYKSSEEWTNNYTFHGQYRDANSGLVYMRNRWYDTRRSSAKSSVVSLPGLLVKRLT